MTPRGTHFPDKWAAVISIGLFGQKCLTRGLFMAPGLEKYMQGYIHRRTFAVRTQGQTRTCQQDRCWHTNQIVRRWEVLKRRGNAPNGRLRGLAAGQISRFWNFPQLSAFGRAHFQQTVCVCENVHNIVLHMSRTWQICGSTFSALRWRHEARTRQVEWKERFLHQATLWEGGCGRGQEMDGRVLDIGRLRLSVWSRSGWARIPLSLTDNVNESRRLSFWGTAISAALRWLENKYCRWKNATYLKSFQEHLF